MILLIMSTVMTSQIVPYVKGSVDPKMLIQGAHPDNPEYSDSSLDYEIQVGVEFLKRWRVSVAYQSHKEIKFKKYSWLVDYKAISIPVNIRRHKFFINCYIGAEMASIFRYFPDRKPTDKYWRTKEVDKYLIGLNAELEIMVTKNFGISSLFNIGQSENELRKYGKDYRYEVMVVLIAKLNKI